jgi:hypothetical protein
VEKSPRTEEAREENGLVPLACHAPLVSGESRIMTALKIVGILLAGAVVFVISLPLIGMFLLFIVNLAESLGMHHPR